MRSHFRPLTAIALASLLGVGVQLSAQPVPTSLTGGSRPGLDVLHYRFAVDFPPTAASDTLRFIAITTARRSSAVSALSLDLTARMLVDSVHVNGAGTAFTRPGDSVRVALPAGTNDTLQVAVFYRGVPNDGLIIRRDSARGWTAFGDNFPDRARQWLATIDHPSDKALVEWIVRAPATHDVIGNGTLVDATPEPGDSTAPRMVRTVWRSERPIYTAVMVIGVAPFTVTSLGDTSCGLAELKGCVHQSVWTSVAAAKFMPGNFVNAGKIVAFYSQLVGPFPYEKLVHVASSTRYGGMENAAAIFYAENLFRKGSPSEGLIAHETAHQWFGDAVTTREWPHVWLSEGFATYFAALWTEHAHGDSTFLDEMADMRADVLKSPITLEKPVVDEGLDDLRRVLNTNVYQKAGFVLHMLRKEIGDSAFFGGIRAYYAAHRHGNAVTADLQQSFERSAGRPLEWFFAQWLRRPGVAELAVGWRWSASSRRVSVNVAQGTRVPPHQLSLAVDVTDADGRVQRVRVPVSAAAQSSYEIPVRFTRRPRSVEFDADVSVLATVTRK